ncbi:MAG: phytanoyl-CoA dioxygenase family protein [Planctomycetota bacterium]
MNSPAYDTALYTPDRVADLLPGPGALDDAAVATYLDQGFLAIADVLTPTEVTREIQRVEDFAAGRVEGYDGVQEDAGVDPGKDSNASDRVRKLWFTPTQAHELDVPVAHPTILSIVSRLMENRAPKLYQAMALLKPPHGGGEKPWHQDHAYFNVPLGQRIVGVWIALDQATAANGCVQLLPGQHKDGPVPHFKRRDWQICDTNILGQTSVAAELPPGGALFFDALAPHGTPMNNSTQRRRAMQFHYYPQDAPDWTDEQRMAVFGSEGKDVYC